METTIHGDVAVQQVADARQDVGEGESLDPQWPHEDSGQHDVDAYAERDVVERDPRVEP